MTIDDAYGTLAFEAPPMDLDAATERIQALYSDDGATSELRDASQVTPVDDAAAIRRVRACGAHCTNLIRMKFLSRGQLAKALGEHGWRVEFHGDERTMEFGPSRLSLGVATADGHKMVLWLLEEPMQATIVGARMVSMTVKASAVLGSLAEMVDGHKMGG